MKNKICVICKKEFTPKTGVAVVCGLDCRKIRNKNIKRKWSNANRKQLNESSLECYHKNPTRGKDSSRRWQKANSEKVKEYQDKWYVENKEHRNKWRKDRYHNNLNYRLSISLRCRLNQALQNNQKSGSAVKDLGCSMEEFKKHLEDQFQEGMTWDNYGRKNGIKCWHIDHIIPISSFDLSIREELDKACNYINLQPLWAIDNHKKGAKHE